MVAMKQKIKIYARKMQNDLRMSKIFTIFAPAKVQAAHSCPMKHRPYMGDQTLCSYIKGVY
jgi:hypothetical protein